MALGANASAEDGYLIHAGKFCHTFRCSPEVMAGEIDNGVVHADVRRGGKRYLVIAYSEATNPGNLNAMCGGGVESNLVWLQIENGTITAEQHVLFTSCRKSIDPVGGLFWKGSKLAVRYGLVREEKALNVQTTFDTQAPEKALQTAETPAEK